MSRPNRWAAIGATRRNRPSECASSSGRRRSLGFTLDEVGVLLTLDAACACNETRTLAALKLSLIEQKMADLAAMRQALGGLVQQCDAGAGHAACPIIDVLTQD